MNKKRITYIGILFIITVIITITSFSYAFLTRIDEQHGKLNMTVGNLDYKISELSNRKLVHCGPLIRREEIYQHVDLKERRKIFNSLYFFSFKAPITYKEIVVNKKECNEDDELSLSTKLVKQLSLQSV